MEIRKLSTFVIHIAFSLFLTYIYMHAYIDVYRSTHFFTCPSIVYLPFFPDDSDPHQYLRMIVVTCFHSLFLSFSALYSHAVLNNRGTSF